MRSIWGLLAIVGAATFYLYLLSAFLPPGPPRSHHAVPAPGPGPVPATEEHHDGLIHGPTSAAASGKPKEPEEDGSAHEDDVLR